MKKRTIAFILAALMLAATLSSCSSTLAEPKEEQTEGETIVTETEDTMETKKTETDRTFNLMMLGSSFCYYYVEELYGLLTERMPEGFDEVKIYNLYYSGCKLDEHYDWWRSGTGKYQLFRTDRDGRKKLGGDNWTMDQALNQEEWDYISLQGSLKGRDLVKADVADYSSTSFSMADPLFDHIHSRFPDAKLFWHNTWYHEIGRVTPTGYVYTKENAPKYNANIKAVSEYLCTKITEKNDYVLSMVNSGAAWIKARELNETRDLLPYGGLCARLGYKTFGDGRANAGDGYHDGDIGGGQLLNAYVWYVTLTGDTDLAGLTYSPAYHRDGQTYTLSPELIDMLKEAALSVF